MAENVVEKSNEQPKTLKGLKKTVAGIAIAGALAAGAAVGGAAIHHHITDPNSEPITPTGIVSDIKGGVEDLNKLITHDNKSLPGFGGGKSGGGGAGGKW
jgi:hypothetical protein